MNVDMVSSYVRGINNTENWMVLKKTEKTRLGRHLCSMVIQSKSFFNWMCYFALGTYGLSYFAWELTKFILINQ